MPAKPQSRAAATRRKRRTAPADSRRPKARPGAASADVQKTRARLDRKRAKRRAKMMWAHYWLLCPKCGGDMFVQHTLGIAYEVCRDCHGIAIDGEELALLVEHVDAREALRAIRKRSKKPDTSEI